MQKLENKGLWVYPSVESIRLALNKRTSLLLSNEKLKIKTPDFITITDQDELFWATQTIGFPCVVKPLISSFRIGQSIVRNETEVEGSWNKAKRARGQHDKILVEGYIQIKQKITILIVRQSNGKILIYPPIGQNTRRSDFDKSWQPAQIHNNLLSKIEQMATSVVQSINGVGVWAVEFFITENNIYFNELCPRPHNSGMVTLAGSQSIDQFDLHIKTMLGESIDKIDLLRAAASHAILTESYGIEPKIKGIDNAQSLPNTRVEIYGKPITKPFRRMGVALSYAENKEHIEYAIETANKAAMCIQIK